MLNSFLNIFSNILKHFAIILLKILFVNRVPSLILYFEIRFRYCILFPCVWKKWNFSVSTWFNCLLWWMSESIFDLWHMKYRVALIVDDISWWCPITILFLPNEMLFIHSLAFAWTLIRSYSWLGINSCFGPPKKPDLLEWDGVEWDAWPIRSIISFEADVWVAGN